VFAKEMSQIPTRKKITITGIVQGVGFRPFVYNRACEYHLSGHVVNTPQGVEIEIEGPAANLESFMHDLKESAPPLAVYRKISATTLAPLGENAFTICHSDSSGVTTALVSPDAAVCKECINELFDPADRRYHYPFLNCTNCGPRYTIIENVPYDRPRTAMRNFKMCARCQAEYDDPANRRFHAQPNACPVCGPQLLLRDCNGESIAEKYAALHEAVKLLGAGKILAVKGLGGFHLAVDATDDAAVLRLRKRKGREEKPLAVMVADVQSIKKICSISNREEQLLASPQSPIVLLRKSRDCGLSEHVAPDNDYLGVMLPYTPLHHLLMREFGKPLVMTSGNFSEEPICIANEDAFKRLGTIADGFLFHNRDIYTRADDSVLIHLAGQDRFVRRSRGYAPQPIKVKSKGVPILAVGGELKNTVCVVKDDEAFVSQHIGDLVNVEAVSFFTETITHLQKVFAVDPQIIVHDLHPDYLASRWAQEQDNVQKIAVQHHHAHLAACLAENREDGPAIGLIMDGTGYGADGTVWGGEVLLGDGKEFKRYACFEPMPLPGGDAAIRSPWRSAVGYLSETFAGALPDLAFLQGHDTALVMEQVAKKINCPRTSSCGRLFDVVAAMSGGRQIIRYEAQAAIEFMQAAGDVLSDEHFHYDFSTNSENLIYMSVHSVIKSVVQALQTGMALPEISRRFHKTLVCLLVDIAKKAREDNGISTVALSGGVYQNHLLFENIIPALEHEKFKVLTHKLLATNDGCIAFGQAIVGRNRSV
jgi:hydrogenase maturation protein HypF